MFTDVYLWLEPSAGMFITIIGMTCLVASFMALVKILRDNMSQELPLTSIIDSMQAKPGHTTDLQTSGLYTEFMDEAEVLNTVHNTSTNSDAASERIKLMFDTSPLIIEYWDKDHNLIDYNETAALFYNRQQGKSYTLKQIDFAEEHQPDGTLPRELWQRYLSEAFDRGYSKFEYVLHKRNKTMYLEVSARRLKVADEFVVVTYTSDISAVKEMLQEKERKDIAESNSQAKSRFLALMSHEIRTPISAVLGIAEIQLHKRTHTPEAEEAFSQIYRSSSTLIGILNDILDLSKIEAGKMELAIKKYDVANMIQDVTQMHAMNLESKAFKFKVTADKNLPSSLLGDELRIKQVLNNILSNAFKYTTKGTVEFKVACEASKKDEHINIVITIKDTGCGMTEEQVAILLSEDYVRFNEQLHSHVQGTGLGVSIAQNLLKLMDASMVIDSTVNVGTNIAITIPQKVTDGKTIGLEVSYLLGRMEANTPKLDYSPTSMPYGRVLVVDDLESNLYVAKGLLELYELQIETSQSAIPILEAVKNGEVYDIIFMDHMMPDMDGMMATKLLREMGYNKPIVALTANALVEQEEEFLQNGFNDFISKPVKATHLYDVLTKHITPQPWNVYPHDSSRASSGHNRHDLFTIAWGEFIKKHPNVVSDISSAMERGDFETARYLAHTTKSLADLLNEKELTEVAQAIEITFAKKEPALHSLLDKMQNGISEVIGKYTVSENKPHAK